MSKVKITLEGDRKMSGYLYALLRKAVDPENTPITKISSVHFEEDTISFEMESRI